MKRLTILAFLAAIGLLALGCGEGSASGGSVVGGGGATPVTVGSDGYTTATEYEDPTTGETTDKISDIKSDGTGATPPTAPSFYSVSQAASVPTPPVTR